MCLNIYGQDTYSGKIIGMGNPCPPSEYPCMPCIVLWLETTSNNYVLSFNSHWICDDKIVVDGIEYFIDDEVEITGTVSTHIDMHSEEYFNLEIESIKNLSIDLISNRIVMYPNPTNGELRIEQNGLIFKSVEVFDVCGKNIGVKTQICSENSEDAILINFSHLSTGWYFVKLSTELGEVVKKVLKE